MCRSYSYCKVTKVLTVDVYKRSYSYFKVNKVLKVNVYKSSQTPAGPSSISTVIENYERIFVTLEKFQIEGGTKSCATATALSRPTITAYKTQIVICQQLQLMQQS